MGVVPARKVPLVTGQFYHIFNRGVAKQPVFLDKRDYGKFLLTLSYYRFVKPPARLSFYTRIPESQRRLLDKAQSKRETLIEIVSFVLMPNHFHLLVKQTFNKGISTFIARAINSYTRYFNTKQDRLGAAFQGAFRVVRVETDEQLVHLSRYIHLNPLVSYVVKDEDFLSYPWSSLSEYLKGSPNFVNPDPVLSQFRSPDKYKEFVLNQADYAKRLEEIKHLTLE